MAEARGIAGWLARPVPFGVWLITCVFIGLLFAGGVVLFQRVAENRVGAIRDLCEHDNANALHNIQFLTEDVKVDQATRDKAKRRFKLTPDCAAFADHTVNQSR